MKSIKDLIKGKVEIKNGESTNVDFELNHNQIASKSKIFVSAVLDFAMHMLLLIILFGLIATPIITHCGFIDNYNISKKDYFEYVEKTHLYSFDEDKNPINSKIEAANYIGKLVKTTYFYEGKEFTTLVNGVEEKVELTEKDVIDYQEDGKYINDNLAYYFFNYRESSDCDLPNEIKNDIGTRKNKYDYFYYEVLGLKDNIYKIYLNEDLFSKDSFDTYISGKSILKTSYAEVLHDFIFLNKASKEGTSTLETFTRLYHHAVNKSFEELDKNSQSYKNSFTKMQQEENSVYGIQLAALAICYVVGFIIYFVILPLILKEHRTPGMRISHLTYSLSNDRFPKLKNIVIKDLVLFLTQAIVMVFPILFLGSNSIMFASFGGFRFVYLIIFFGILSLTSAFMSAFGKNHQFLSEYTSLLVEKDSDSLKISEENAVID